MRNHADLTEGPLLFFIVSCWTYELWRLLCLFRFFLVVVVVSGWLPGYSDRFASCEGFAFVLFVVGGSGLLLFVMAFVGFLGLEVRIFAVSHLLPWNVDVFHLFQHLVDGFWRIESLFLYGRPKFINFGRGSIAEDSGCFFGLFANNRFDLEGQPFLIAIVLLCVDWLWFMFEIIFFWLKVEALFSIALLVEFLGVFVSFHD